MQPGQCPTGQPSATIDIGISILSLGVDGTKHSLTARAQRQSSPWVARRRSTQCRFGQPFGRNHSCSSYRTAAKLTNALLTMQAKYNSWIGNKHPRGGAGSCCKLSILTKRRRSGRRCRYQMKKAATVPGHCHFPGWFILCMVHFINILLVHFINIPLSVYLNLKAYHIANTVVKKKPAQSMSIP